MTQALITIYTTRSCPFCIRAKGLLRDKTMRVLSRHTRRDNVAERLVKRFGASIGAGAVRAIQSGPTLR